jgi:hypothetical protein
MECGICFEVLIQNKQLNCMHELCIECYYKLRKNTCPFCRSTFTYSQDDIKQKEQYHEDLINYDTSDIYNTSAIFDTYDTSDDTYDTSDIYDTDIDYIIYNVYGYCIFVLFLIPVLYIILYILIIILSILVS